MARSSWLQIRVSRRRRALQREAVRHGLSVSEYVRSLAVQFVAVEQREPAIDARRFIQTTPVTTKADIEQNTTTASRQKDGCSRKVMHRSGVF